MPQNITLGPDFGKSIVTQGYLTADQQAYYLGQGYTFEPYVTVAGDVVDGVADPGGNNITVLTDPVARGGETSCVVLAGGGAPSGSTSVLTQTVTAGNQIATHSPDGVIAATPIFETVTTFARTNALGVADPAGAFASYTNEAGTLVTVPLGGDSVMTFLDAAGNPTTDPALACQIRHTPASGAPAFNFRAAESVKYQSVSGLFPQTIAGNFNAMFPVAQYPGDGVVRPVTGQTDSIIVQGDPCMETSWSGFISGMDMNMRGDVTDGQTMGFAWGTSWSLDGVTWNDPGGTTDGNLFASSNGGVQNYSVNNLAPNRLISFTIPAGGTQEVFYRKMVNFYGQAPAIIRQNFLGDSGFTSYLFWGGLA